MWLNRPSTFLVALMASLIDSKFILVKIDGSGLADPPAPVMQPDSHGNVYRIIGGQEASPHQYPWMVIIRETKGSCGGTVLNADTIMTAAHCINSNNPEDFKVAVGAHAFEDKDQVMSVKSMVKHPLFNPSKNMEYDIGILKLRDSLKLSSSVSPVCLPESSTTRCQFGSPAIITGWGKTTDQSGNSSPKLQFTTVSIAGCGQFSVTENVVCATAPEKATCLGDSGGPLVQKTNSTYIQCGITSFGGTLGHCFDPKFPTGFSRVTALMDFIREHGGSFCVA